MHKQSNGWVIRCCKQFLKSPYGAYFKVLMNKRLLRLFFFFSFCSRSKIADAMAFAAVHFESDHERKIRIFCHESEDLWFWSSSSLCGTRASSSAKRKSRTSICRTLVLARERAGLKSFPSDRVRNRIPSSTDPNACFRRIEKKMLKSVGTNTQSFFTQLLISNASDMFQLNCTFPVSHLDMTWWSLDRKSVV